jgi:hypothetical protein
LERKVAVPFFSYADGGSSVFRARTVVKGAALTNLVAEGKQDFEIAEELEVNRHTPALGPQEVPDARSEGLWEIQAGSGRKPLHDENKVAAIIEATLQINALFAPRQQPKSSQQGVFHPTVWSVSPPAYFSSG